MALELETCSKPENPSEKYATCLNTPEKEVLMDQLEDLMNLNREISLVIVGHLAFNEDRTPSGTKVSIGGSAYYAARGASIAYPQTVGIVASVGEDFDLELLTSMGVNIEGVTLSADIPSAKFIITQLSNGTRHFEAQWGAACTAQTSSFPKKYTQACHIHLATMPPMQQLQWIRQVRSICATTTISVDTFEQFAVDFPEETMEAIEMADIVFANQEEANTLNLEQIISKDKKFIVKKGPEGASYIHQNSKIDIPAPKVVVSDTTGAGDVLAGAFLNLRINRLSAEQALEIAIHIASSSIADFGVDHEAMSKSMAAQSLRLHNLTSPSR